MTRKNVAIRKLALSCMLPAALVHGPLMQDVFAQNVPSANSKLNAGQPIRKPPTAKKAPAATPQPQPVPSPAVTFAPPAQNTPRPALIQPNPVRQVANPAPQQAMPNGRESDVQRQLRMLYEKSGQEMPAMTLDELEVPEPQPGVQPGAAAPGMAQPNPEYAQPPAPKAPNFFERVFLGKKAPPPTPSRLPQRPVGTQPRQGQQNSYGNPATNGTQPRSNYRPYQAGQPGQSNNRPAVQGQQAPQGYSQPALIGQQPGMISPQNSGQQAPPAQQRPSVIPAPVPGTGTTLPANQSASPPQLRNPQSNTAVPQLDDVPLLDDEAEESLDITVTPNGGDTAGRNAAGPANDNSAPPANDSDSFVQPDPAAATGGDESGNPAAAAPAAEENPFSGLQLNVPEPVKTETPAPQPGSRNSRAASTAAAPKAAAPAAVIQPDPFEEPPAESGPSLEIQTPPAAAQQARPGTQQIRVISPPAETAKSKTTTPRTGTSQPPATISSEGNPFEAPVNPPKEYAPPGEKLRQLANAAEKTGLKGFCPVALRQKRQLLPSKPQFNAIHEGQKYYFSSFEAKAAFEKQPDLFAPAHGGRDAIALLDDDQSISGTLDYSAWFQGRLYLFASRQNLEAFNADPEGYLDESEDLTLDTPPAVQKQSKSTPPVVQPVSDGAKQPPVRNAAARTPATFEDLPVLSESLEDDADPFAAPAEQAPEAKAAAASPKPIASNPALDSTVGNKPNSSSQSAPATEKPSQLRTVVIHPQSSSGGGKSKVIDHSNDNSKPAVPKIITPQRSKADAAGPAKTSSTAAPAKLMSRPVNTSPKAAPPKLISPDLRLMPAPAAGN